MLLQGYQYSQELERTSWDFAVEWAELRRAGLTNNDLRWLSCKGYVEHARELPSAGENGRAFRCNGGLTFGRRTCFILTPRGVAFARRMLDAPSISKPVVAVSIRSSGVNRPFSAEERSFLHTLKPRWDRDRQELRLGTMVVKQFKVPAVNQERILAAFEEEGWPTKIHDPLPPAADQDPKRRLHDTINSLNRNQKRHLIRFLGDGSGQGVRWDLAFDDVLEEESDNRDEEIPSSPICQTVQ